MDPRPFAEIVWYLLHSRKYLQPKKNSEAPDCVVLESRAVMVKSWVCFQTVYKHTEQINNQNYENIDNSECFGVKFVKIYPEMTSQ